MTNQRMNKFELIKTLKDICKEVAQKHQNVTVDFDRTINNSYTHQEIFLSENSKYKFKEDRITISTKGIYNAQADTNGDISVAYLVDYVKVLFHELQHVNQYKTLFQQKKTDAATINMARKDLIALYFPNYYDINYFHIPSELDAEQHGFSGAIEYFHQNPQYLNNKNDAEEILYNVYHDLNSWYLPAKYRTPDCNGIIKNLESLKKLESRINRKFEHVDYDEMNANRYQLAEKVLNNPEYKNYLKAFNEAPNGVEQDKILMQIILREDPKAATIYKCLESECKAYLKAFKHTDKSTVIPSSQVYSIMSQEDVHTNRVNHLEDKFGDVLAAEALEHDNSTQFL